MAAFTCCNCGKKLSENCNHGAEIEIGVLRIENGSNNYPIEPDEPARAYFECIECREERIGKKVKDSVLPEELANDQDLDRIQAEETLKETLKRARKIIDSAKSPISLSSDREKAFYTIDVVLKEMGY